MLQYVLFGAGYGFAAAVQPGPLQAFLLTRVATDGWRRTLPACLSPLLSDGPIALVVLLIVGRLPERYQQVLRVAGGALLLYFAWAAVRRWRDSPGEVARGSAPRTLFDAALVNLFNPNPYLGWTLVLGPSLVAAWRDHPSDAFGLIGAFYGTLIVTTAAFILLVGAAGLLGGRVRRILMPVSAAVLGALGVYLLATGMRGFAGA